MRLSQHGCKYLFSDNTPPRPSNCRPRLMILLTPDELRTWTGYKHPKRQIAWLRAKGYRFDVNAANRPIVSRSYWERLMGGAPGREAAFHNFAALEV
jgi:hypothetical protein